MDNNQNQRNNNPLGGGDQNGSPRKQNIILLLVAAVVTMVCMTYFMKAFSENTNSEVTYTEFIQMVDDGKVDHIIIVVRFAITVMIPCRPLIIVGLARLDLCDHVVY